MPRFLFWAHKHHLICLSSRCFFFYDFPLPDFSSLLVRLFVAMNTESAWDRRCVGSPWRNGQWRKHSLKKLHRTNKLLISECTVTHDSHPDKLWQCHFPYRYNLQSAKRKWLLWTWMKAWGGSGEKKPTLTCYKTTHKYHHRHECNSINSSSAFDPIPQ